VEHLGKGVDGVPAAWRGSDWYAEYLVHYASAFIDAGQPDLAAAQLGEARQIAEAVSSRRVVRLVATRERRLYQQRLTAR
jgi:hypothetical protein